MHRCRHRFAVSTGAWLWPLLTAQAATPTLEEVVVLGNGSWSEHASTHFLQRFQPLAGSVLGNVDKLPGLHLTQGDALGMDDWSTTLSLRGLQSNLTEQSIGSSIDGLPNGDSSYTSGSKANRFIDPGNLGEVSVMQGTADIGSRSLEALGGTLDFRTAVPLAERRLHIDGAGGNYAARRIALRADSGSMDAADTRLWLSWSRSAGTDWIARVADNERQHTALRFVSSPGKLAVNGYLADDDAHEDNYERLSRAQFEQDPFGDGLSASWTGIPWQDQQYRTGWSTLRRNRFAYLKLAYAANDRLRLETAVYQHRTRGRGDWLPPFMVDLAADPAGAPQSELGSSFTARGGSPLGLLYFVDANGRALSPLAGCVSSLTQPYGGAGPEYDPACHAPGAIPVQTWRHTHHRRERSGLTADASWQLTPVAGFNATLRSGLWYEDGWRNELRDWHRIRDTRSGPEWDERAYWQQFSTRNSREVVSYYYAAELARGPVTVTLGRRHFRVDLERTEQVAAPAHSSLQSEPPALWSFGLVWQLPPEGLELFAGQSDNAKPLTDAVLAIPGADTSRAAAEAVRHRELGLRLRRSGLAASAVVFGYDFDNRLEFLGPELQGGIPDYLLDISGSFLNLGGQRAHGVELAASVALHDALALYGSWSRVEAEYLGSGVSTALDALLALVPGNRVTGTPRDMLVAGVEWKSTAWSLGLAAKYVADRYIDRLNTSVAEGYTVLDLNLRWQLPVALTAGKAATLDLSVNNLADTRYQGGIAGFGAWTGAPRTLVVSLGMDF